MVLVLHLNIIKINCVNFWGGNQKIVKHDMDLSELYIHNEVLKSTVV